MTVSPTDVSEKGKKKEKKKVESFFGKRKEGLDEQGSKGLCVESPEGKKKKKKKKKEKKSIGGEKKKRCAGAPKVPTRKKKSERRAGGRKRPGPPGKRERKKKRGLFKGKRRIVD